MKKNLFLDADSTRGFYQAANPFPPLRALGWLGGPPLCALQASRCWLVGPALSAHILSITHIRVFTQPPCPYTRQAPRQLLPSLLPYSPLGNGVVSRRHRECRLKLLQPQSRTIDVNCSSAPSTARGVRIQNRPDLAILSTVLPSVAAVAGWCGARTTSTRGPYLTYQ